MSYADTFERMLDKRLVDSSQRKLKQSQSKTVDYSVIEDAKNEMILQVEGRRLVSQLREAEKQEQSVSIDTSPAKKAIAELKKELENLIP